MLSPLTIDHQQHGLTQQRTIQSTQVLIKPIKFNVSPNKSLTFSHLGYINFNTYILYIKIILFENDSWVEQQENICGHFKK